MDSDGTLAYEGGGYSFSVGDNINQFGSSTRSLTPGHLWPLCPI